MPFLLAKNVRGDFPHRRTLTTEYSVSKDTFSNGCKKASTAGAAAMITIIQLERQTAACNPYPVHKETAMKTF
jgi:hypothetical protein